MSKLLNQSCRVALAALIRDIGQFAGFAGIDPAGGKAAFRAFDAIGRSAPELVKGDMTPFAAVAEGSSDSIVDLIANGNRPQTFIQWIVAAAEAMALGTDLPDLVTGSVTVSPKTRLRCLLQEISLSGNERKVPTSGYALVPFSADASFPKPLGQIEPDDEAQAAREYRKLWDEFAGAIDKGGEYSIPEAFRKNWSLWLDVFDTAWMTYTNAVPSQTQSDVSLYDTSRAVASLAVALWRWHEESGKKSEEALTALQSGSDKDEKKFLVVQGDFFGIQSFIFTEGAQTDRHSAKILRGRSFYVSLMTELAALKVLQTLELPCTSQIMNAAGKFVIIAPNTPSTVEKLKGIRAEIDRWYLENTYATADIGIAWCEASSSDFLGDNNYTNLCDRMFDSLERVKYRRFDLVDRADPVVQADYSRGVCAWQSRYPADGKDDEGIDSCAFSRDHKFIGRALTQYSRVLILDGAAELKEGYRVKACELPLFGFKVAFTLTEEESGVFGAYASSGALLRCWDFSLPGSGDEVLWHGYARRNINGFVARDGHGDPVTFEALAGRGADEDGAGIEALMTLKGDVDNLGLTFQNGLKATAKENGITFSRTAALSRAFNTFFAVYLPVLCAESYADTTYTVYAGGDDFFLIGSWNRMQDLAFDMQQKFSGYTGHNEEVHFSAGLVLTKPAVPPKTMARMAEEAIEKAKGSGKNRVQVFGEVVEWSQMDRLADCENFLREAFSRYRTSMGYMYSLFHAVEMRKAADYDPRAAMWRSRLYYNTVRMFERQKAEDGRGNTAALEEFLCRIHGDIDNLGSQMRIPLSNVFYSIRKTK